MDSKQVKGKKEKMNVTSQTVASLKKVILKLQKENATFKKICLSQEKKIFKLKQKTLPPKNKIKNKLVSLKSNSINKKIMDKLFSHINNTSSKSLLTDDDE